MKPFTNGGTCATKAGKQIILDAQRDRRYNEERELAKQWLGVRYLMHPENQGVSWRGGL
tara:strand:+ start:307 stop:483 length:177 start_codon:yes stop_codon:yes gene_type:complete